MKITHQRLPTSVYIVFAVSVLANAIVTFVMLKYFL
jgi:hypothetical protein